LTNVTRHSQASRTEVVLKRENGSIYGELIDDGVGFDQRRTQNGQGMGMTTMKQRVKKHGGELSVESSPGKGTRVAFVLPLNHAHEHA
jgi:signal transduction histidine kinase